MGSCNMIFLVVVMRFRLHDRGLSGCLGLGLMPRHQLPAYLYGLA